jgi:hypothetical protein
VIDIVDDLNRYAEVSSHPATILDAAAEIALLRRMMVECEVGFEKLAKENRRLRAALSNIRHKRREMVMGDLSADEAVWEVDAIARAVLEGKHE